MTGVIGRHRTSRDPVSYPDRVTDALDDDQPLDVGIVVPTMGDRPRFISESISSIRDAGQVHITVVKPRAVDLDGSLVASIDQIVDDPGRGLAAAINSGLRFIPETVADFRWHEGSLSVGGRQGSVEEASRVRRRHLPALLRAPSIAWEVPMRALILAAGRVLDRRLSSRG